jgi:hypothetical protein
MFGRATLTTVRSSWIMNWPRHTAISTTGFSGPPRPDRADGATVPSNSLLMLFSVAAIRFGLDRIMLALLWQV